MQDKQERGSLFSMPMAQSRGRREQLWDQRGGCTNRAPTGAGGSTLLPPVASTPAEPTGLEARGQAGWGDGVPSGHGGEGGCLPGREAPGEWRQARAPAPAQPAAAYPLVWATWDRHTGASSVQTQRCDPDRCQQRLTASSTNLFPGCFWEKGQEEETQSSEV